MYHEDVKLNSRQVLGKEKVSARYILFRTMIYQIAGAARRATPDSMLILCLSVYVSEIISRPLIGQKTRTSRDDARRRTT